MLNPTRPDGTRPRLSDHNAHERPWASTTGWEAGSGRCHRVSCVVLVSNQARELADMLPRLSDMLTEFGHPWEIIVVDVESHDDTDRLMEFWSHVPGVHAVHIPRAVNRLHGLARGLSQARGDVVITCTPRDVRWAQQIPRLLLQWEAGSKLICPAGSGAEDASPAGQDDAASLPACLSRLALLDRQVIERLRIAA